MPKRSRQRSRQRSQRGGGVEEGGMPKGVGDLKVEYSGAKPEMPAQDPTLVQSGSSADVTPPTPPAGLPPVQSGGKNQSLGSSPYAAGEGGFVKSQYYTISGGSRKRKYGKKNGSKRRHRKQKGGSGVLATAAVPFGLLALQRYFKGSRKTKKGVANMGRSFKRTFRRRY